MSYPPPPYQHPDQPAGPAAPLAQPPLSWTVPPDPPRPPRERDRPPRRGSTRRRVLIAGAGVAALGVGAVIATALSGGDGSSPQLSGPGDPGFNPSTLPSAAGGAGITTADLTNLITRLNKALTSGDKAGYVACHAGAAVTQAGTTFDNMREITFEHCAYQLIGQGGRDFNAGAGASTTVDVALVHQISGVDLYPLPEWYRWTVTHAGPGAPLAITAVTGSPSVAGQDKWVYYPAIWDSPNPIHVVTRPGLVLGADNAADGAVLDASVDQIAAAVAANRHNWTRNGGTSKVAPGLMAIGTSNRTAFYNWYSGKANQYGNEAGLAIPIVTAASMDAPGQVTPLIGGCRVVMDLTSTYFTAPSGETNAGTLGGHEDFHNIMFSILTASLPSIPYWAVEGLAEYFSTQAHAIQDYLELPYLRTFAAGSGGEQWDGASLPTDGQVYNADPTVMGGSYALSAMAIYCIAAQKGLAGVVAFAQRNFVVPSTDGVSGSDVIDSVLTDVLGEGLDQFQSDFAAFTHRILAGANS